jgi:SAM-dependent methyltransferase
MKSDPSSFYDSLASEYNKVFSARQKYHDAVDSLILNSKDYSSWSQILDVGSGNGKRLTRLFLHKQCVLHCVESSSEMVALLKKSREIELVIQSDFCTLDHKKFENPYDLVLMQWNVIGHLSNISDAFKLVSQTVKVGGHFIFDFNNPLNYKQYGFLNALRNSLKFLFSNSEGNLKFKISHEDSYTETYFYKISYIYKLLDKNGFRLNKLVYLNYTTGEAENRFGGQVFIDAIRI